MALGVSVDPAIKARRRIRRLDLFDGGEDRPWHQSIQSGLRILNIESWKPVLLESYGNDRSMPSPMSVAVSSGLSSSGA